MKQSILYIFILVSMGVAQQLIVKTNGEMQKIPVTSHVSGAMYQGAMIIAENRENAPTRYIVELTAPSRIEQKRSKMSFAKTQEVQRLEVKQNILKKIPALFVEREYSTVMNGFSVQTEQKNLQELRSLSGVKNVYRDVAVTASPYSTNTLTPTKISSTTLATGKGIKVGIIDTGIDYMHEALGEGFGSDFKVAGGYDFVNNDNDPMDDNGHGTHVAGIIAGQSATITSYASNAKLYAYKVLNSQGGGNASDVIAAIEKAVNDSVAIINLSLGSTDGDPNDALCTAVNRAVEAGVVVVVAAGNTGDFGTINSPGVAKLALTVGAFDTFGIASFSAKGPVPSIYDIKPDVVAPGVGILSAKNGGGYIEMSGTSMATPYVSGIAAALEEIHPGWSSIQIRDAIISNARDLNVSVFAQGNGKVDENKTFTSTEVVTPAHLTFGFNSPSQTTWIKEDTLLVFNASSTAKKYHFEYPSKNPALTITFSPDEIEIPPMEYGNVIARLTTNNLFLSDNKNFPDGYTGKIFGYGNTDTLSIPFTFFKGNILQLKFSEMPWQVVVHNQKNFSSTITPKTNNVSLVVNQGTYDVITSFYNSYYVVTENMPVSGQTEIPVDKDQAIYNISIIPSNERGDVIDPQNSQGTYHFLEGLVFKPKGFSFVGMSGGELSALSQQVKHFSPMSDKYSYGYSLHIQHNNTTSYTYDVALDSGITSSKTVSFLPTDLHKVEMKYESESPSQKLFPIAWTSFITPTMEVSVTYYNGNDLPLLYPFVQTSYYSNSISTFPIFHSREAYKY